MVTKMTNNHYILGGPDGRTPIPVLVLEWAEWFATADRVVAKDTIGDFTVSTVFIGRGFSEYMDLFETMVFTPDKEEELCLRCSTWQEAEHQHKEAILKIARESLTNHDVVD